MTTHFCLTCSQEHPMHYVLQASGSKCLIVDCPMGSYAIKLVQGLDIPVRESRKALKLKAKAKQTELAL